VEENWRRTRDGGEREGEEEEEEKAIAKKRVLRLQSPLGPHPSSFPVGPAPVTTSQRFAHPVTRAASLLLNH
jgi:hypothetical protein